MKCLIVGVLMVASWKLAFGEVFFVVERLEPDVMRRCLECTMSPRVFYLKPGNDSGRCSHYPQSNPLFIATMYFVHCSDCKLTFVKGIYTPKEMEIKARKYNLILLL